MQKNPKWKCVLKKEQIRDVADLELWECINITSMSKRPGTSGPFSGRRTAAPVMGVMSTHGEIND